MIPVSHARSFRTDVASLGRLGVLVLLATAGVAGRAATPAPIPVTVNNTAPVPVDTTSTQPFVIFTSVPITSGNGDVSGIVLPAGKRFVVQTASAYRSGSLPAGVTEQIYIDSNFASASAFYAMPLIVGTGGQFPGQTMTATFSLANGFEISVYGSSTAAGNGTIGVTLSGYLVNMP